MGAKAFSQNDNIKTPLWTVSEDSATAKQRVLAVAHTALTAKTPYKIIIDEYGYKTMAITTEGYSCFIGVPESSVASGAVGEFVIQGFIEDVITPSLSVAVGHAFYLNAEAIADKGADYTGEGTEFAICCTASTSSTTQDMYLTGRMLDERLMLDSATNNTEGAVFKIGTCGTEAAVGGSEVGNATADLSFVRWSFDGQATTGTHRGLYIKLYLTGGAGGEALRAYTTVINAAPADTCNGAHISINFGTSAGNITGQSAAIRATYHIANRTMTGTNAVINADLWCDGASSAGSNLSFFRCVLGGNSTGVAAMLTTCYWFNFDSSVCNATNGMVDTDRTANTAGGAIRILVNGATKYITYGTGS